MKRISIKLFASLARYNPSGGLSGTPFEVVLTEDSTLGSLIQILDLPMGDVKLCFVNGRMQELDYQIQDGDEVGIFPPIGGG